MSSNRKNNEMKKSWIIDGRRSCVATSTTTINLICLIVSCHVTTIVRSDLVVSKCCPPGQVFSPYHNYTCAYHDERTRELHPLSRTLNDDFSCADTANLEITSLADIEDTVIRASTACLDFLWDGENIPVVIECRTNDDVRTILRSQAILPVPRLSKIRLCCGANETYDARTRKCVDGRINVDFAEIFGFLDGTVDFLTVDRGSPKCDHAIVDHVVNVTENKPRVLDDGSLEVVVNSKNGRNTIIASSTTSCVDPDDADPNLMIIRACSASNFCKENKCVRKCCPEGEAYFRNNCSKIPSHATPVNFHDIMLNTSIERGLAESVDYFNTSDYGLLIGKPCVYGMFPVETDEGWHMNTHGHIYLPTYRLYEHDDYCAEVFYMEKTSEGTFIPSVCFDIPESSGATPIRFGINAVLELISCTFLIATLLVYICLPALQNLHGKTLMCHVASLIVAYGSTAALALEVVDVQENFQPRPTIFCKIVGYTVLLSWIAAFSWLNVMCFDIWWTFGGLGGAASSGGRSRAYRKRFFVYSMYAWGLPIAITTLAVTIDSTKSWPESMRPNIGTENCWFKEDAYYYGRIIFFLVPVSLQLIANVAFFVLTAMHCSRVKAEISRLTTTVGDPRTRRFRADRTKLVMNVKLFIVMGMTWTLELISGVLDHYEVDLSWRQEFFYVPDAANCLQGVLIFMLFVLKSKVYYALRRRLATRVANKPVGSGGGGLQDPFRVRKSASSSTIMSNFAVSTSP